MGHPSTSCVAVERALVGWGGHVSGGEGACECLRVLSGGPGGGCVSMCIRVWFDI